MVLLRVERVKKPVPFFVEETDAVTVENVHHVRVVSTRRRNLWRRIYLGSTEELHSSVAVSVRSEENVCSFDSDETEQVHVFTVLGF